MCAAVDAEYASRSSVVLVHVKNKVLPVSVGAGTQPVQWLANVGVARFDLQGLIGEAKGVTTEDGAVLPMDKSLVDAGVRDGQHVWLVF